ncbi:MAG TPA: Xaa-Pro peptidase family protein [candidate division Zixibacteria bacterium]|nr:Xaa-Pro peptidase family protein [candidate division Zixibacteria bacterium]
MKRVLFTFGLLVCFFETAFCLPKETFKQRRAKLMELVGDGVAVLYGKTGGFEGEFKQDNNFYYLTGVEEPGAILVLSPKEKSRKDVLLLAPRNPEDERWSGERPSIGKKLEDSLGFEYVGRTGGLGWMVNSCLQHTTNLCYLSPPVSPSSPVSADLNFYKDVSARVPGTSIKNMSHLIRDMRAVKTDEELAAMQKAIDITGEGFKRAALALKPGLTERDVQDLIENEFKTRGARRLAFSSIVATGKNTTVLHYTRNDATIKEGDLFLMDIGAEYDHYAADVSRTIPVSGKFSPEQRKIYEIVLKAQKAAMAKVKPGAYVREDVHAEAKRVIEEAGYGEYFIHGTSHFIGLDVHDVGDYGSPLKAGMVISVEPGIYIPEKGIGVRIEDDVLVTKNGYKNLTAGIPREIEEIEKLLSGK